MARRLPTLRKRPRPGDRAAHRSLDEHSGGARAGVVRELVGDDEQRLVVLEGSDGELEGFDDREVVSLGRHGRSSGPVLLHPRHLLLLLRRRRIAVVIIAEIVVLLGFAVVHQLVEMSDRTTAAIAGMIVGLGFIALGALGFDES
jgi:hypothetical protein